MKELLAIITRGVVLLSGFGIVMLNLRFAGLEGQGTISLINSGILILSTLSAFIGGGSIVYLLPRLGVSKLLAPSLIWLILSAGLAAILLFLTGIEGLVHAVALGSIQSLFLIQQMILLGENRSKAYQWMLLIQSSGSFIFVAFFYLSSETPDYLDFIKGIYGAFALTLVAGFYFTWSSWKQMVLSHIPDQAYPLWKYGKYTQTANIFHLSNQRSYLFFLERSSAEGILLSGIFSVVMYIAEALWSVPKSLSAVQGAEIAQTEEHQAHKSLTIRYLRISLISVVIGVVVLLAIPESWFNYWLKDRTSEVFDTLKYLLPGILFNVFTVIFAHYFSGKGLHRYNTWSAAAGLIGSLVLAPILIVHYGITGAAIAASCAFGLQSLIQTLLFIRASRKNRAFSI
jgi:O-antigen/teichoic acid export membrane protein